MLRKLLATIREFPQVVNDVESIVANKYPNSTV